MNLIPCNKLKAKQFSRKGKNAAIIEEFVSSGEKVVKLEGWEHKNATVCRSCIATSIKRCGYAGIRTSQRGNEIYLINDNV